MRTTAARKALRRTAAAVVGTALAASALVAVDHPTAIAATGCSASFSTYSEVRRGTTGAKAEALECLLARAGYTTTVDGQVSSADAKAMAQFRVSVGLRAIGTAGPAGWAALLTRGSTPTLESGDKGTSVLRLQQGLRAFGYRVPTDSRYRASTVKAVKTLQRKRALSVTGKVNDKLWDVLQHGRTGTVTKKQNKGQLALAFAKKQLGDRYSYGASGPNAWDCSGLTSGAWKAAGVTLPHSARQQFSKGKKVAKSDLKPGDLVFFYSGISHVAIYAGGGKVIHASQPGRPVAYIKMSYMPYKGARRPG